MTICYFSNCTSAKKCLTPGFNAALQEPGVCLSCFLGHFRDDDSTEGSPSGPAVVRSCLPDMPESIVCATSEDFQPPIEVVGDRGVRSNHSAQGSPSGPAVVGSCLPDVPQGIVEAAGKDLQPAIRVPAGKGIIRDDSAE